MSLTNSANFQTLATFDPRSTTWQSYRDRMNIQFKSKKITDDEEKKFAFLCAVGDATYELLDSFVSPKSLIDDDIPYSELISILDSHYDNRKHIMTATYDFYSCVQKPGQTFLEWKTELREKLRHCGFNTSMLASKPQDRALRDMYIIGVNNPKIRQALLKEQDPDLETTERIIASAEKLQDDVRHFKISELQHDVPIAKIGSRRFNEVRSTNNEDRLSKKTSCMTCGSGTHQRSDCRFRNATCNHCKRIGHLQRVCRAKHKTTSITNRVKATIKLSHVSDDTKRLPLSAEINLIVNGRNIVFEIDTGASVTIVNEQLWKEVGKPKLRASNLSLTCYSGVNLKVRGICDLDVKIGDLRYNLSAVIIEGMKKPLLGLAWLKQLRLDLNELIYGKKPVIEKINQLVTFDSLSSVLQKHQPTLNRELGHCTKLKASIQLRSDAKPKFFKPRSLPFAYVDQVKTEIERQVELGILEKVDSSDWAAPIVPVIKPNGKIRICGDFKLTINRQMCTDQHPIPSIDEVLTKIKDGRIFSKLDLSDAYLQIELDDESKKIAVINTSFGLFRYVRMPFGISNAPAIFQRVMDQVISGIPRCVAYLDDILITGSTIEEHLSILDMVLTRLSNFGFRCNPEKCSFLNKKVSYLGFVIDENGIHPDPDRVSAIRRMPTPRNIKELEAFIGKLNYYGRFVENFSKKSWCLNRLRRLSVNWDWNEECQTAFDKLKNELSEATLLVHFNPELPVVLATDASSYGIGAVILHRLSDGSERPIAHASKTLNKAEENYSQIEKEGLSIVFGVKKFHQFLVGREFELCTDHQPLVSIFNPNKGVPASTASRLQRWSLFLMGYSFRIRYKTTKANANADALSRLPCGPDDSFIDESSKHVNLVRTKALESSLLNSLNIEQEIDNDHVLFLVRQYINESWPKKLANNAPDELISYFNNRNSLSVMNNCILKDSQVVIPKSVRHKVLKLLHRSHLGTVKMKQLARLHCWWPKIEHDIESLTKSCEPCVLLQPMPNRIFQSWPEPDRPWSRVHIDFAGPCWGSKWLLIIDAKTKFPIAIDMRNDTTADSVIEEFEKVIDWFGAPESIVSDNGPPFTSFQLKEFFKRYNIQHVTTPPYHPASNGIIERFVRSFKEGMEKELHVGHNNKKLALRNFLRSYRWSPHSITNKVPVNMMFQFNVRSALDALKPRLESKVSSAKFLVGQKVMVVNFDRQRHRKWKLGIIEKQVGSIIYLVRLQNGKVMKLHANQIRNYSPSDVTSESDDLDSLFEDLSPKIEHQANNTPKQLSEENVQGTGNPRTPKMTARHLPTRNRKPPIRYSP